MQKYDKELLKRELRSALISDVLDQMGYRNQTLSDRLRPLDDDVVIFGPAFTSIGNEVYSAPENPLIAQCRVVDQLSEDEVYILATRGNYTCAVFGELFATAVNQKKGAGVLLDGYVRDVRELKEMHFPVFFCGYSPRTSKGRCEINECQIPVSIDGVTICPGDMIFGDIDGVVVVPKDVAEEAFERALETKRKEDQVREGLVSGETLEKVYTDIGAI